VVFGLGALIYQITSRYHQIRLGERRTLGDNATAARAVQGVYTDELLRMMVVVTAVAMLLTYAGYVQDNESRFVWILGDRALGTRDTPNLGINLLWLTMLPATYAVLRSIVLLERGEYDDPTELATKDRDFQIAAGIFAVVTAGLVLWAGPAQRPVPVPGTGAIEVSDQGSPVGQESARSMADERR